MLNSWLNVFIKPKEVFAKEKNNASLVKGVVAFVVSSILFAFYSSIFYSVDEKRFSFSLDAFFGVFVYYLFFLVIVFLVSNAVSWAFSRFLGGKGGLTQQYYLSSLPFPILSLVNVAFLFIFSIFSRLFRDLVYVSWKNFFEFFPWMVIAAIWGVWVFLFFSSLKEIHKFGFWKCIATIVFFAIIFISLFFLCTL